MLELREANANKSAIAPFPASHEPCPESPEVLPEGILPYRGETYYGIPPVKHSHYRWRTATAFLFNGIGGGSQILSTLVDLFGSEEDRKLVRTGRYLALTAGIASTVTLISSLHNWQHWYNMLRIFKKTSPMSIGIWAITPFNTLSGMALAGQIAEDFGYRKEGRWMGRMFGIPASVLGGFVMSYMGTELEETNTPLWASAHPLMAPLYVASGMSNSTAALLTTADVAGASEGMKQSLSGFAVVAGIVELALCSMIERRWSTLPEAAAFEKYPYASLFRLGVMGAGISGPLALRLYGMASRERSLVTSALASLGKLAGGLLMQMVLIYSGRESGREAIDYFEYTRPERLIDASSTNTMAQGSGNRSMAVRREFARKENPERNGSFSSSTMLGLGLLAFGVGIFAASVGRKRGKVE